MDGTQKHATQDCQNAKKVDADAARGDEGQDRGADQSTGSKSCIASSDHVAQPGGLIIRVGTIGCSGFGLQRCEFGSA